MCSREVLILVNQSIEDVKDSIFPYSLFCLRSLLNKSCPQTPSTNRLNDFDYLQIKSAGAYICPFDFRGLPQPQRKTDRETPTLRYIDTRKVCVEDTRPSQHTTESIYYTPWSYPCICSCSLFDCGSFESPKTKRQ